MGHPTVISITAPNGQHADELPRNGPIPALDGSARKASLDQVDVITALVAEVTRDIGMHLDVCEEVPSIEVVDVSRSSSDAGIKSKSALTTVVNCVEEGYSEDSLQRVLLVQSDVRAPLAPPSDCEDSDDEDEDDMYIPRGLESQGTRIKTKPGVGSPAQYAQPVSLTGTQRLQTQNVPGAPSPSRAQAQGGVSASASQIPVPASQPGSAFKPSVVQTSHPTSGLAVTTTTPPPQNQHAPQTAAFGHAAPLHPSIEGRPPTAPSSSRSLFSNLKKVLSNGRPTEQTSNGGTASMSPPRSAQNQTHKTKKGNRGGL